MFLYPLADKRLLARIERERVPPAYFHTLAEALRKAVVYGPVVVSHLRTLDNPDAAGEMADLFMRLEGVTASFCYGEHDDALVLSLRCYSQHAHAGEIMQRIVAGVGRGGGHNMSAGGQVPLEKGTAAEKKRLTQLIRTRCCRLFEVDVKKRRKLLAREALPAAQP